MDDRTTSDLLRGTGPARIRRRRLGLLLASGFVIATGAAILRYTVDAPADSAFTTVAAARGDLEETVSATGKLQPVAYVDVGAQASGQLKRVAVRVGDFVTQGDLLAEIDPQVQVAKIEADQAQIAQFNANLVEQQAIVAYAQATLARYSRLVEGNSISKLSFDEANRDAKTAAARVDAIRAQISQMQSTLKADQVALGYTRIFAPMSGTVVSIDAREGQTLNATYSTPQIMRVADLKTMTVWTQVSEADVTRLRSGTSVYFTTLGHRDRRWVAKIRQILPAPQRPERPAGDPNVPAPTPTNNVVVYTALFDVENAEGELRPEMTAQVFFVVADAKNAVIAPVAALRSSSKSDDAAFVTVLDRDGRTTDRKVQVGLRTRFQAEILAGLEPGERIVTGTKAATATKSLVGFRL
jgi:membrane fusion protein, macrolide-specific efflux system